MPENLLEFYAATTDTELAADGRHPSQAVEKLTQPGTQVRYCRSILVSTEKTCFVLLEADSLDDVLETIRLADVACDRVSPAVSHPVPAGVTGVHVVAVGSTGISCCDGSPQPGRFGATFTADVPLPAQTPTAHVKVGGNRSPILSFAHITGGFDGGGNGSVGGVGASDVRTVSCTGSYATGGSSTSPALRLAAAAAGGRGGGASEVASGGSAGNGKWERPARQPAVERQSGDSERGGSRRRDDNRHRLLPGRRRYGW
jgi:hypothetical protein